MSTTHKKHQLKKKLYSNVSLVGMLILVILFSQAAWGLYQKKMRSEEGLAESREEVVELEERKGELEHDLARLKSDEGLEEEIRDKFNVAKEGEETVIIIDPEETEETKEEVKSSFFEKIWDGVTGWF